MKRTVLSVTVCAVIVAALRVLGLFDFEYREAVYTLASVALFVVGALILKTLSPNMRMKKFLSMRGLRSGDTGLLIWMTVLVISGGLILNYLSVVIFALFGKEIPSSSFATLVKGNPWLNILYIAVIPAILEELFFRGAVLTTLNGGRKRTISALLISSALFALVHGSYYYILSNFFAGMVFALVVYTTNSVYVAMAAHFLNNSLSYLLYVFAGRLEQTEFGGMLIYIVILVFLIALYNAMGSAYKRYIRLRREDRSVANEGDLVWQREKEKRKQKKSQS